MMSIVREHEIYKIRTAIEEDNYDELYFSEAKSLFTECLLKVRTLDGGH